MTNAYYNPTGAPAQGSALTSPVIRAELTAIQAGFDKLPTLTGNGNKLIKVNSAGDAMTVSAGIVDQAASTVLTIGATGLVSIGGPEVANCPLAIYSATNANLVVQGDANASVNVQRFSTDLSGPSFVFKKSRGTVAGPSAVTTNDIIGSVSFNAFAGTNTRSIAGIVGRVDTYTSDTQIGGYLTFATSPNSAAVSVENMRIGQDGTTTLGGTSANPALKVNPYTTGNWVTISSGTNPTIGTSAGSLNLSSSVNCLDNLYVGADDALGAGGVGSKGLFISSSSIAVVAGSGAPNISAAKGSLYLRSDGSTTNDRMYVNTDGATTWTAVTTVA